MRRLAIVSILIAMPASACEPIVPMMYVIGGPLIVTKSLAILIAAVVVKCALFALFQKQINRGWAALFMFLGNILTTIVGVLAMLMLTSPQLFIIGIPVVFLLCWIPARRIPQLVPQRRFSAGGAAALMTAGLILSCVLFLVAQGAIYKNEYALYWAIKLVAVYAAMIVSIALTSLWEEWVVWKLSRRPPADRAFVAPVLRANLYTILLVMLYAAVQVIPERLKSPNFLV